MKIKVNTATETTYGAAMAQAYINQNGVTEAEALDRICEIVKDDFGNKEHVIRMENETSFFYNDGLLELYGSKLCHDSQAIVGWYCNSIAGYFAESPATFGILDFDRINKAVSEHVEKRLIERLDTFDPMTDATQ